MLPGYRMYEHTQITTADRGRLLLLLYEGAIAFLHEAERQMRQGDGIKARLLQTRAFEIISELMNTLNHQATGEIASYLRRLYAFMLQHLAEGNVRKDPQHFDDVAHLLTTLHSAFAQAVTLMAQKGNPPDRVGTL
ncbi:MAG: flagellar export chaperone FliS [Nitrospinae bacterium]|nr:flagellar export chaperone FliS [Nitrospinota bacterium]